MTDPPTPEISQPKSRPPQPTATISLDDDDVSELVQLISESYRAEPLTRHIDAAPLPSRTAVVEVIQLLRELLFPGYVGKQSLAVSTIEYQVGSLLLEIRDLLLAQVVSAFRHQARRTQTDDTDTEGKAKAAVNGFLATIPNLRAILATDVQATFEGDPAAADTDEIIFSYPGFLAVTIHRLAHELHVRGVPLIPRIMSEFAHSRTGVDIHPGAKIAEYFFIDHGTGVVIGETSEIGKRVKIYQGVTLGALSLREGHRLRGMKRHPTLEDEVTVYSGASILGGDTVIGTGVVIASNVFVTQSVPPRTRVSVRNPELRYRNQQPQEFIQDLPLDWSI
jgi:serine O-acetyltransferase